MRMAPCLLSFSLILFSAPAEPEAQPQTAEAPTKGSAAGGPVLRTMGQLRVLVDRDESEEDGVPRNAIAFELSRVRLMLAGPLFRDSARAEGFAELAFDRGAFGLKAFGIDLKLRGQTEVRLGQFKRPFSRQFMISAAATEFLERPITGPAFGAGRDIGLMFHNGIERSPPFEWAIGLNNGTGDGIKEGGTHTPEHFAPELVARVGYNHGGLKGYTSEADLSSGPLRFGVAMAAFARFDEDKDQRSEVQVQADAVVKYEGISATAAYHAAWTQDGESVADQDFNRDGLHLQVGYMISDRVQPAARFALVSPSGAQNDAREFGLALNVFIVDGHLKWQSDFNISTIDDALDGRTRFLGRSQLQWLW